MSRKMATKASKALFARARGVMPGGVSSPVRAFKAVGGTPIFVSRGKGSHVWSADGARYIDYVCSWGPLIAGHSHPKVTKAIYTAAARGTSFGAPSENELKLAEKVCHRVPSVEMVRFVSSGTEATMSALRLARAYTRRDKLLKFDGCYHGHSDAFLTNAGSGLATLDVPSSAGVPASSVADTVTIPYNDIEALESAFASHRGELAAVIVEPVAGNMGVVPPKKGFLETARSLCSEDGSLLIFDEVITGFRLSIGGAQELLGVRPDITCLGKVIGGGFPVGAYGGAAAVMRMVAPEGPVYQAGTLSGNPVAMAAGLATISLMEEGGSYSRLDSKSARLERGLREEAGRAGVQMTTNRVGSMLGVFFSGQRVTNFEGAKRTDRGLYARFHRAMLDEGVYLPPSAFETLFVSTAHTGADVDATVEASRTAFAKCTTGPSSR
ncbi:MAG TPA: glutamate-1-semialdehyde 2,1-aminomutase [Nitrososphaerales archaeon]|nr:glutamate-1-semialdehyde 2,1-aminomutase [Nitrososphaerales archaeon]